MENRLTQVTDKILANGLLALREMVVTPRVVNRSYEMDAMQKGNRVDIPIPSAINAIDVAPAATLETPQDISPTAVSIELNKWKQADFHLTDKELKEVMVGTIPMQVSEAVRALANEVDKDVLGYYKGVYGFVGTAGTTPFATNVKDATGARKVLNNQLAPLDNRCYILDPDAEANALDNRAFQDSSWTGDSDGIKKGDIGEKFGAVWKTSQNILTHTAGSAGAPLVNGTVAVGDTTVPCDGMTGDPAVGDIITFAGHDQTYCVLTGSTRTSLNIRPGLVVAPPDDAAITVKASHVVNLAFHRDAFALAVRPLAEPLQGMANISQMVDTTSGLALRLEVVRQHKRTSFQFDILWGAQLVRPELACRIAG